MYLSVDSLKKLRSSLIWISHKRLMEPNIVLEIIHTLDPDQIVTFDWKLGWLSLSSLISTLLVSSPSLRSYVSQNWRWGDGTLLKAQFLLHAVKLRVCIGSSWNENRDGTRYLLFNNQKSRKSFTWTQFDTWNESEEAQPQSWSPSLPACSLLKPARAQDNLLVDIKRCWCKEDISHTYWTVLKPGLWRRWYSLVTNIGGS